MIFSWGCVARSRIPEVMQDTKFLLQQSREKLVITYVFISPLPPPPSSSLLTNINRTQTRGERPFLVRNGQVSRYDPFQLRLECAKVPSGRTDQGAVAGSRESFEEGLDWNLQGTFLLSFPDIALHTPPIYFLFLDLHLMYIMHCKTGRREPIKPRHEDLFIGHVAPRARRRMGRRRADRDRGGRCEGYADEWGGRV